LQSILAQGYFGIFIVITPFKGYGAIVGAGIGNAVADCIAGLPEGKWAALGKKIRN
jgi:hypothetical protein